jgi:hypothetical protein
MQHTVIHKIKMILILLPKLTVITNTKLSELDDDKSV